MSDWEWDLEWEDLPRKKQPPIGSALLLIECLASMVDDLARGMEQVVETANPKHDMEPIMLTTLSLTNMARRFVVEQEDHAKS